MHAIVNDHVYLLQTPEDKCLNDQHVLKITDDQINEIELKTTG